MSNAEAIKKLIDAGATHEKKEDGEGVTRSGWWQDTAYLAPYRKPKDALQALFG
jgi:hypothetical protein